MSARTFTPDIKVEHVISFSDAVFAFAITLMALTIGIPDLPPNLSQSEMNVLIGFTNGSLHIPFYL